MAPHGRRAASAVTAPMPPPISLGVAFGVPFPVPAPLSEWDAAALQGHAVRIRTLMRTAYVAVGRELIAAKQLLGHGGWHVWLSAEFGWTVRTAENLMSAAQWLEGKSEKFSDLPASVVYLLASPSTPKTVQDRAAACVERGERLMLKAVRQWIAEAGQERAPEPLPGSIEVNPLPQVVLRIVAGGPPAAPAREAIPLTADRIPQIPAAGHNVSPDPSPLTGLALRHGGLVRVRGADAPVEQEIAEHPDPSGEAARAAARFLAANLGQPRLAELLALMDGTWWPDVAKLLRKH